MLTSVKLVLVSIKSQVFYNIAAMEKVVIGNLRVISINSKNLQTYLSSMESTTSSVSSDGKISFNIAFEALPFLFM